MSVSKSSKITCPCVLKTQSDTISRKVFEKYVSFINIIPPIQDVTKNILDKLNLKCPHCSAVYFDFDGCISLQCNSCAKFFCALCQEKHVRNKDSHAHVLKCTLNPNRGSYYITNDQWIQFVEHRQRKIFDESLQNADFHDIIPLIYVCSNEIYFFRIFPWRKVVYFMCTFTRNCVCNIMLLFFIFNKL